MSQELCEPASGSWYGGVSTGVPILAPLRLSSQSRFRFITREYDISSSASSSIATGKDAYLKRRAALQ